MTKETDITSPLITSIHHWLASQCSSGCDHALLYRACLLTQRLNQEVDNKCAVNLLEQGLAMASQLMKLQCDNETLSVAIIYPSCNRKYDLTELITKTLGKQIAALTNTTLRMETIDTLQNHPTGFSQQRNQADNLRKMLLAMVGDVRGILIKLAERFVTLTNLRAGTKNEQQQVANQVMTLYAPLANRLGIGQFKWQMEDWAFRYLDPNNYGAISRALNMRRIEREQYIKKVIDIVNKLLVKQHIKNVKISGRAKHIYSIYRKIQRKHVDFSEVYDASAIRILAHSIKDCYSVLSIVHTAWQHIAAEFDDYIAKPKPNGYRSIHTAVIGPEGRNVEIQIRTYTMHDEAELGVAAHWKYKESTTKSSNYAEKINRLREIIDWQKEVSTHESVQQQLYKNIFTDRVYAFTPNGDILSLATGATPLDFAYHIHTEIGHRCRGARINGIIAPLTQKLQTGDRVEILTAKHSHPSRDWLNNSAGYLVTSAARTKVRHWFRQQNRQQNITIGRDMWEQTCRRTGIAKNALKIVYRSFNFKSTDDLLAALGADDTSMASVLNKIHLHTKTNENTVVAPPVRRINKSSQQKKPNSTTDIEGVDNPGLSH